MVSVCHPPSRIDPVGSRGEAPSLPPSHVFLPAFRCPSLNHPQCPSGSVPVPPPKRFPSPLLIRLLSPVRVPVSGGCRLRCGSRRHRSGLVTQGRTTFLSPTHSLPAAVSTGSSHLDHNLRIGRAPRRTTGSSGPGREVDPSAPPGSEDQSG